MAVFTSHNMTVYASPLKRLVSATTLVLASLIPAFLFPHKRRSYSLNALHPHTLQANREAALHKYRAFVLACATLVLQYGSLVLQYGSLVLQYGSLVLQYRSLVLQYERPAPSLWRGGAQYKVETRLSVFQTKTTEWNIPQPELRTWRRR
ncbi:MAG: hypothetical protein LBH75_08615 [Treponema sp.]|nr:hypothetical protein [Treponema sp.]